MTEELTENIWRRARRPAQKAIRREAILDAADTLFNSEGLEGVSLNAIAREVSLAKSNLYRYFESREAIFLALLERDQKAWTEDVEAKLAQLRGVGTPDSVAKACCDSFLAHPRLCSLSTALTTVLEHNLALPTVRGFKEATSATSNRVANALGAALPALPNEASMPLVRFMFSLLSGIWPASNPASTVTEALNDPRFAHLRVNFEKDFTTAVSLMIRGALSTGRALN